MGNKFLTNDAMLTVILQCDTPETAIGRIRNANMLGADAYGLQVESLKPEFQNPETYQRIFAEGKGRPFYVTYYRGKHNSGKTDEELASGMIALADSGAVLCDVMGDLFCKHPEELTERVLEIALEQKRRGADIIKIVTGAKSMEQQIENLRITDLLKRELDAPFLFLSNGVCSIHRRLSLKLGCCMALCVYEHDAQSTATQPLLSTMKKLRDEIDF